MLNPVLGTGCFAGNRTIRTLMRNTQIASIANSSLLPLLLVGAAFTLASCGSDQGSQDAASTEAVDHSMHGMEHSSTTVKTADLTLESIPKSVDPGKRTLLNLQVKGADGKPIKQFDVENTKKLHLILVKEDLSSFQHLHPKLRTNGRFTQQVSIPNAGGHRLIADFSTAGQGHVLTQPLKVNGTPRSKALPKPALAAKAGDFNVAINSTDLTVGEGASTTFTITKNGKAVKNLQPYLGAMGHLVVLKEGSLEYIHAHPEQTKAKSGVVGFHLAVQSAGQYRTFLQFRVAGKVHTAAFTLTAK